MRWKLFMLRIKSKVYKCLHKDNMEILLEIYRIRGAKIGGAVRAFSPISSAEPYLIEVGSGTTISTKVSFVTHDNSAIKVFENATDFVGSIKIGKNCFIGFGSILLPGVSIADNCIVGAGSVITRSFNNPGKVIAGNPAHEISDIAVYAKKYEDLVFNFKGMNSDEKKMIILNNGGKWLRK